MQRVQAGRDLHRLNLVDGLARGIEGAAEVQGRPAVGIVVLDDQVLHLLGVDEGCREGMLLGLNVCVVLEAVLGQQFLDLLVRAGRDLVNHRPGEGHLRLIAQVRREALRHQAVLDPALGVGQHTANDSIAVMRAVVHRLHGERQPAGVVALEQQGCHLTHGKLWLQSAGEVVLVVSVAFLGDGKRYHLQRGLAEYLHQALPVGVLRVGLQGLGDAGNDFLLYRAVGTEVHAQREVVVGGVGLVDDFKVEGLCHNDAAVVLTGVQRVVEYGGRERPEDVATPEMDPRRLCGRLLTHGLNVKLGELIAFRFPLGGVQPPCRNVS